MLYAIVAVIVLILDQGLKYWTTVNLELGEGVRELLPGVVHLTNIHNSGAAFGLLDGLSFARWLFVGLTVVFVVVVVILISTKVIKGGFGRWMATLVVAGALGNGIDRVIHGYVVDMFELEFISFPVFNIADIFITVCGILFCIYILLSGSGKEEKDEEAEKAEKAKAARLTAAKRSRGNVANIDDISRISGGGKVVAKSEDKPATAVEEPVRTRARKPAAEGPRKTVEQQREEYARRQRQTYEHGARTTSSKDDFFAEWEKKQEPAEVPVFTPPSDTAAETPKEEKSKGEPAAATLTEKEKTRVTVDDVEMEFSLEDILNEFK